VSRRDGATLKSDYFTLRRLWRGAVTPWRYWRRQCAVSFTAPHFLHRAPNTVWTTVAWESAGAG